MGVKLVASSGGSVELVPTNTASNFTVTVPAVTASMLTDSSGVMNIGSGQIYKDASGNVGIGTSSPAEKFHVNTPSTGGIRVTNGTTGSTSSDGVWLGIDSSGQAYLYNYENTATAFYTNNTERMRIDSSGNLLVGTTSTISVAGVGADHALVGTTGNGRWTTAFRNTGNSTPWGIVVNYSNASPNNTSQNFVYCYDSGAERFSVRSNGGISNYSANNVNLSDERTKTDIQNAGGYLTKICAIPVRTFKYKDQTDDLLNLGVIAQEVEAVAPELVDVSGFGETPEDGVPLKAIYQTDLQYALMKCIQEQQSIIQTLTDRITVLESK